MYNIPRKKFLGTKFGQKKPKIRPRISFFFFASRLHQDCSLGQCLKSSRAETSKKKKKKKKNRTEKVAQIGAEMIFFILMSWNVYSHLLVCWKIVRENVFVAHRILFWKESIYTLDSLDDSNLIRPDLKTLLHPL